MTTTMDTAGRLVIPSEIRREAGLEPGVPLEVRWREGVIEIEPQPARVRLVRKGRLLVASRKTSAAVLTHQTVERTRSSLRSRKRRG